MPRPCIAPGDVSPRPRPGPATRVALGNPTPPPDYSESDLSSDSESPDESGILSFVSGAFESLDDYVYSPLANPRLDIRLVELLPGALHETITIPCFGVFKKGSQ